MKIRLSKAAIRDLREINRYIAADSEQAASRVVDQIRKSVAPIGRQPNIGRLGAKASTREWSVNNLPYVIPYRILGDTIEITRIWHTSRNRPSEW